MLFYVILDSEYYKSQALRNAKEAYQIHQEKVSWCMLIPHAHYLMCLVYTRRLALATPALYCADLQMSLL